MVHLLSPDLTSHSDLVLEVYTLLANATSAVRTWPARQNQPAARTLYVRVASVPKNGVDGELCFWDAVLLAAHKASGAASGSTTA